ncbi:hypothetical protein EST38_g11066 [Candolleomyces aberdarensis]|uniref:Uncharacterized protein n=1 Tax=Candolleomyces aberdarensis TaxID=2316362 RepID=A0A4V1Q2E3_9AGAR|nr:hypothetical protein EST38_g11066 [Candolleomyces aberdarensis]
MVPPSGIPAVPATILMGVSGSSNSGLVALYRREYSCVTEYNANHESGPCLGGMWIRNLLEHSVESTPIATSVSNSIQYYGLNFANCNVNLYRNLRGDEIEHKNGLVVIAAFSRAQVEGPVFSEIRG